MDITVNKWIPKVEIKEDIENLDALYPVYMVPDTFIFISYWKDGKVRFIFFKQFFFSFCIQLLIFLLVAVHVLLLHMDYIKEKENQFMLFEFTHL